MTSLIIPTETDTPETPLVYAKPGDAAVDLRAATNTVIPAGNGRALIPTGIRMAIPDGHLGMVLSRSGLALKRGVHVLNAPGIVDSGYRGDIGVILCNTDPTEPFHVSEGDRIAQFMVLPCPAMTFVTAGVSLGVSERGVGGFGHTGL